MEETIMGYSYCPTCRTQATGRTRGIPTYDMCGFGHKWLASDGLSAEKISEFDVAQAEQKRKDALIQELVEALEAMVTYPNPPDGPGGLDSLAARGDREDIALKKAYVVLKKAKRNEI